jgi:hypothetical protein
VSFSIGETNELAEVNLVRTTGTLNLGLWELVGDEYDWNIHDQAGCLEFEAFTNNKNVKPGDELVLFMNPLCGA